jgi:hypothetical protein
MHNLMPLSVLSLTWNKLLGLFILIYDINHIQMMATNTHTVVDPKSAGMMLYRLPVLSPTPEPFCLSASLNKEKLHLKEV